MGAKPCHGATDHNGNKTFACAGRNCRTIICEGEGCGYLAPNAKSKKDFMCLECYLIAKKKANSDADKKDPNSRSKSADHRGTVKTKARMKKTITLTNDASGGIIGWDSF